MNKNKLFVLSIALLFSTYTAKVTPSGPCTISQLSKTIPAFTQQTMQTSLPNKIFPLELNNIILNYAGNIKNKVFVSSSKKQSLKYFIQVLNNKNNNNEKFFSDAFTKMNTKNNNLVGIKIIDNSTPTNIFTFITQNEKNNIGYVENNKLVPFLSLRDGTTVIGFSKFFNINEKTGFYQLFWMNKNTINQNQDKYEIKGKTFVTRSLPLKNTFPSIDTQVFTLDEKLNRAIEEKITLHKAILQ